MIDIGSNTVRLVIYSGALRAGGPDRCLRQACPSVRSSRPHRRSKLARGDRLGSGDPPLLRIGGASRISLPSSALLVGGETLVLALDRTGAELLGSSVVEADLEGLANWLGMKPEIRVPDELPP